MEKYIDVLLSETQDIFNTYPELEDFKHIPAINIHQDKLISICGLVVDDVWLQGGNDVEPDENGYIKRGGQIAKEDGFRTVCFPYELRLSVSISGNYNAISNVKVIHRTPDDTISKRIIIYMSLETDNASGANSLYIYDKRKDYEIKKVRLKYNKE